MYTDYVTDRLLFLDNTLKGIIKRFEDEFPDTREYSLHPVTPPAEADEASHPLSSSPTDLLPPTAGSDIEDEPFSIRPPISRSNSVVSMTSRALSEEEGRVLRAGHKFRSGIFKPRSEHYMLLSGIEAVGNDPNHVRFLHEMLDELDDDELRKKAEEIGVVRVFQEERERVLEKMKQSDPEHWERFAESQIMASKNRMDGEVKLQEEEDGDGQKGEDKAVIVD